MKLIYELTEKDIKEIIAGHLKVTPAEVTLETYPSYEGYGDGEHEVFHVRASVVDSRSIYFKDETLKNMYCKDETY